MPYRKRLDGTGPPAHSLDRVPGAGGHALPTSAAHRSGSSAASSVASSPPLAAMSRAIASAARSSGADSLTLWLPGSTIACGPHGGTIDWYSSVVTSGASGLSVVHGEAWAN